VMDVFQQIGFTVGCNNSAFIFDVAMLLCTLTDLEFLAHLRRGQILISIVKYLLP
jgi:hypothetical protein